MASTDYDLATIVPGPNDLIRIVPLHGAEQQAVAGAPAPKLTYRGGPLLGAVKVFTLFWGAAWNASPQDALATGLNTFFDEILTSSLIDQLAEYSVPGSAIGHGQRIGTTVVTRPRPHATVSDTTIRHMLQHQIASNAAVPKPDAQTLYFVYLPPGTTVTQGGSRSCQAFCGYHDQIGGPDLLRGDALPRLQRLHRQPDAARRAHFNELARALRGDHGRRSRARAGTTTPTARSATSAPGRPRSSAATPSSSSGRTRAAPASDRLSAAPRRNCRSRRPLAMSGTHVRVSVTVGHARGIVAPRSRPA